MLYLDANTPSNDIPKMPHRRIVGSSDPKKNANLALGGKGILHTTIRYVNNFFEMRNSVFTYLTNTSVQ